MIFPWRMIISLLFSLFVFETFLSRLLFLLHVGTSNVPDDGFNPKVYNKIATTVDKKINGIKTIIHEITESPCWHNKFSNKPTIISNMTLKNAALYTPLKISKIIWTDEKIINISAGGQIFAIELGMDGIFIIIYF